MEKIIIEVKNVSKKYIEAEKEKYALNDVSLNVYDKEDQLSGNLLSDTKFLQSANNKRWYKMSGRVIEQQGYDNYYKIDPEAELIVLYDDICLPVGQLRVRPKGSAGGHNGIKSIIQHLGTENFQRIRVGVGEKPSRMDLADYVLGHFTEEEKKAEAEAYDKVSDALLLLMEDRMEECMNK